MSTAHLSAVKDRPLPLRQRADLTIESAIYQDEQSWIVKDPVSLKYHRLRKPEIIVLEMLDGNSTLEDIKNKLQHEFPTKIVRLSDLQSLISSLYRAGMLLSDAPGQADQLLKRDGETKQREWIGRLSNVLAIRFPGYDPEKILDWLHPKFGWIFDRTGITVWLLVSISAGALLLSNLDEFQRRLPNFYEFFSARNFVWLALVMAVTKICHELGHGLSCKHFGGECHEIGFMLLVFTPAMYCDTSDSWLLPNKWHRAFIGFAGMYVEVFLASIATFLWWFTQPGLFNFMCLNVMFVSSISTIVFNANPLLRYDGYYILADILEIPNLAQKSRLALLNALRVHCLGMRPVSQRQLPAQGRFTFISYSIASFLYRWFVLIMIVWFVSEMFEPYGLQIIGQAIIAMSAFGLVVMPLWKLGKFFSVPGRIQEVKKPRLMASTAVLAVLVLALTFVPLPKNVATTVVIRPDNAERVYVSVPGSIETLLVQPGDHVKAGQTLAVLKNIDATLQVASLTNQQKIQETKLALLRHQRVDDDEIVNRIPVEEAGLADVKTQLVELRNENEKLNLTSTTSGIVLPPVEVAESPEDEMMLSGWDGTPFDADNRGAVLETGTLFCIIGDPKKMQATLILNQTDVKQVKAGQPVRILLEEYPNAILHGEIREVAKRDLQTTPRELTAAAGGPLATETDPTTGQQKSMFVMYEAVVPLHDTELPLMNGFRGKAKILVGRQPLASRMVEFTRNMLHFR